MYNSSPNQMPSFPENNSPKKKGISPVVIIIILLIIGIGILSFLLIHSLPKSKATETTANQPKTESASQDTSSASANASEDESASSSSADTGEEPSIPDYKTTYLKVISKNSDKIDTYNWQYGLDYTNTDSLYPDPQPKKEPTPIAVTDITGDDIPELLMMYCKENDNATGYLAIYTVNEDGDAKKIYNDRLDCNAGGGAGYFLFQTNNSNDLYAYKIYPNEYAYISYSRFHLNGEGKLKEDTILSYEESPSDDYSSTIKTYQYKGKKIKKSIFNSVANKITKNVSKLFMYNDNYGSVSMLSNIISSSEHCYLSYGEALRLLSVDEEASDNELPFHESISFYFSSGAGGWGTSMTLNPDGTFNGEYHDSNLGEGGKKYDSTVYISTFEGTFEDFQKTDDNTYTMKLANYKTKQPVNKKWIKDRVRYIAESPYGIEGGKTFRLYLPGTPVKKLPNDYVSWIWGLDTQTTLNCWGLYNVKMQEGFSGSMDISK